MITEKAIREAIAYCNGKVDPNRNDAVLLAACYILQDHLFPADVPEVIENRDLSHYSFSPETANLIDYDGESEFAAVINGRDPAELWPLLEELVETIRVLNPRLYNSFMRRVKE